jgi:hypothetical protein
MLIKIVRKKIIKGEHVMSRIEKILFGMAMLSSAAPVFAGGRVAPAPVAGVGIGAVLLIGVGYRALKSRIGR